MNHPCRYCEAPKRHVGCKSDCPELAEWTTRWMAIKAEMKKSKAPATAASTKRQDKLKGQTAGSSRKIK